MNLLQQIKKDLRDKIEKVNSAKKNRWESLHRHREELELILFCFDLMSKFKNKWDT